MGRPDNRISIKQAALIALAVYAGLHLMFWIKGNVRW